MNLEEVLNFRRSVRRYDKNGAGINMVIPCGIRDGNKGIWGERGRIPFDEIYHRI